MKLKVIYCNQCCAVMFVIDLDGESDSWANAIDRGGLNHVSNMTFLMFELMELKLRKHLKTTSESINAEAKEMMIKSVSENEDVLFFWSHLSANWPEYRGGQCTIEDDS